MKRLAVNTMSLELGPPGAQHAGALMNSTEELVARVRAGDEEAFRLIFNRYSRPVRGVIQAALMKLDEDKRTVFTLKVLQQRSYEEIAEITGFSVGKLKTDLHRARAEMRKRIGPYLGGEQ